MQRIKLDVFKSFFEKDLTGKEIDFLIVLSFYQDIHGTVQGVHYREMMEEAGMSAQSFYDCKASLVQKGVIRSVGVYCDYDITLIGNDFSLYTEEDYQSGNVKYLSTACRLFRDRNFRKLKPKQKLLVMDLYNIQSAGMPNGANTYRIRRENFLKKYADTEHADGTKKRGLLGVTVRTLQKYLKMLRLYFSIALKDGMYYITMRRQFMKRELSRKTEKETVMEHLLKVACRRNQINEPDQAEWNGILNAMGNREKDIRSVDVSSLVGQMVAVINESVLNPKKWKRRLKTSLFVKLLNEATA